MGKVYAAADVVEEAPSPAAPPRTGPRVFKADDVEEVQPEGPGLFSMQTLKDFGSGLVDNLDAARRGLEQVIPFSDEIKGAGAAGEKLIGNVVSGKPATEGLGDAYRGQRDADRAANNKAADEHPASYYLTNLGGSIALPGLGTAVKGTSLAANAARAAAPVAEAAAIGIGQSEADATRGDLGGVLRDAGSNAKLAGATAAGAAALSKGAKYISGDVVDKLKQRVLNEFAEGAEMGSKRASPTQQAKLARAGEAIVDEVVTGPDAALVRHASAVPAEEGRKVLAPVIGKVGESIGKGYDEFEKAAPQLHFSFDDALLDTYLRRLGAARDEAVGDGKIRITKGIDAFVGEIRKFAENNRGRALDLRQLRGITTDAQGAASSAIGSLNEHNNARLLRQIEGAATEAMDDTLSAAAAGNAKLADTAAQIRASNRRYFALKTIDDALEFRTKREAGGRSLFTQVADKLGSHGVASGAVAGATAAYQDPEHAARNVAIGLGGGAILKGAGRAARAIDRGVTTRAIDVAAGRRSVLPAEVTDRLARLAGRGLGRATVTEDDEE